VEGREVKRHVGPELFHDPFAQSANFLRRIVFSRNEQRRDLDPGLRLVLHVAERVEHGIERAGAKLAVEILSESLEVDIGGIHGGKEFRPRRLADIAGCHRHGLHASLAAGDGDINRIFKEDHRVVVSEGHRAGAASHGGLRDRLGRGVLLEPVVGAGFGDVPVLAELAREIAPGGAERENRRSRQEMVERLLFNRIEAEAGRPPIGREHNVAVCARPHEAKPPLPFVQFAFARAKVALDAAVSEPMPIAAGH
jgi:hypothetical protein